MHAMILFLVCLKVPRQWLLLFIELSEEFFILENCPLLSLFFLFLGSLFSYDLGCWHASQVIESTWLEPAVRNV